MIVILIVSASFTVSDLF